VIGKGEDDPHAGARAAIERCWLLGRRLAEARHGLHGLLPTSPEALVEPDEATTDPLDVYLFRLGEMRLDAYLFRLSAALTTLIEEATEPVLLAGSRFMLFLDVAEDLRALEAAGAIASADQVLGMRDRVRRHYLIPTLAPEERAAALNQAWTDGQSMIDLLVGLSRHIQSRDLVPGLVAFGDGQP